MSTPRIRIESDGTYHNTAVYIDDKPVPNACALKWEIPGPGQTATATITFFDVDINADVKQLLPAIRTIK